MAKIELHPDNRIIDVHENQTLLEASLKAGIAHANSCGGRAKCSTCRVVVNEGLSNLTPPTIPEQTLSKSLNFSSEIRLACQTKATGDVKITRPIVDEIDKALADKSKMDDRTGAMAGKQKNVTILFSDIEKYTPFAASLPPYDIMHVLDRYFNLMGNVVKKYNGRIIDYYGDGILAVFGFENDGSLPLDGVRAANEMFKELDKLNPYLESMYNKQFNIRIGMHYGKVIMGTIGIEAYRKCVVIGDAVNFASRIESTNKKYNTNYLISESLYNKVSDHVTTAKKVETEVKGKNGKYTLYEVVSVD